MLLQRVVAGERVDNGAPFLQYVHLFRGVAILLIVLIHLSESYFDRVFGPGTPNDQYSYTVSELLFHDATLLFTLISGILYVRVYSHRTLFYFAKSRGLNVILPYIVLTVFLTMAEWWKATIETWWSGNPSFATIADWPPHLYQIGHSLLVDTDWLGLLERIGFNIFTGGAWEHLWYVPVIFALYLISPLTYAIVSTRRLRWLTLILLMLPLVAPRTEDVVTLSSVGYFLGAYALGMFLALDLERSLDFVEARLPWFVVALVIGSTILVALSVFGPIDLGIVSPPEIAFYIQKISLGGIIIVLLRRWTETPNRSRDVVLGRLATWAFGIYFIHPVVMNPMFRVLGAITPNVTSFWLIGLGGIVAYVALIALCAATIMLAHRLIGRRSRYLIGA